MKTSAFPEGCTARDDMNTVVSELIGNCWRHGKGTGTQVTLVLLHSPKEVGGLLLHHAPPAGTPAPSAMTDEQTACLLQDEELPEDQDLAESGRGLLVIEALTERFTWRQNALSSLFSWSVPACSCGQRSPAPAKQGSRARLLELAALLQDLGLQADIRRGPEGSLHLVVRPHGGVVGVTVHIQSDAVVIDGCLALTEELPHAAATVAELCSPKGGAAFLTEILR